MAFLVLLPAVYAVLQVIAAILILAGAIEVPPVAGGAMTTDAFTLATIVLLIGFAVAMIRGHLWGTYVLLGQGLAVCLGRVAQAGMQGGLSTLLTVVVYGVGTWALQRRVHSAPSLRELRWGGIIRYAALMLGGVFVIVLIFNIIGLHDELTTRSEFWVIYCFWAIAILTLAAKWGGEWPLETAICVGLVVLAVEATTVPFSVLHNEKGWIGAVVSWLTDGTLYMGAGAVAWGVVRLFPVPVLGPQELPAKIIGLHRGPYGYAEVMRDTRWLLLFAAAVQLALVYYLATDENQSEATFGEEMVLVATAILYVVGSIVNIIWLRMVCIIVWVLDLTYGSLVLNPEISPSIFIPVGIYFIYLLWTNRQRKANSCQEPFCDPTR